MDFNEAKQELEKGNRIKLPEWIGYWFKKDGKILVHSRTGDTLDTPFLDDYKNRTDWELTDGSRDFGGALIALKAGKLVARSGWNGKGMFIFLRPSDKLNYDFIINKVKSLPDALKKYYQKTVDSGINAETQEHLLKNEVKFTSYLCMKAADGTIVNGWLASQTDMLAEDWQIVE